MARLKTTQEDVELARVRASLKKAELICDTIRWCVLLIAATAWIGIIAWATVQITDKPAWLTFFLALIGLASPSSVVAWWVSVRLRRKVAAAESGDISAGTAGPSSSAEEETPT